ncbi:LiaI-LiaF-like domain-containing protein [Halalkalibacter krulwichiae]|uniref:LiaI-LiaF-like transmembrane region domain-containing protein n=1 Tax=Halalkalibacter krulwichiae TaxID=199441 RepID=A0A1X9MHL7_9BACI|nr:DUF5668 domain-containing protein [Halalkalibacter krulwichiae]ARK31623.1 hypothetical protein BkAM31D_18215 [Halalkalibacter krulwichiae]
MKSQRIFPGALLIGIGIYFFLQQYSFPVLDPFLSWPSLLFVIGAAMILQAYIGRENSMILPGVILTGLSIHFHLDSLIMWWPNHWGMYTLIAGIAFLIVYVKVRKEGLIPAIVLLTISFFSFTATNPFLWFEQGFSSLFSLWPILLIGFGLFLLIRKK